MIISNIKVYDNISNEEDINTKNNYVALSKLVYNINKLLLDTLAIDLPEKM